MRRDSTNRKSIGIVAALVLIAVLFCSLFLFLVFRLRGMARWHSALENICRTAPQIPDGNLFDLSENAQCYEIWDYEYGEDGRLICAYGYQEKDDGSGMWILCDERRLSYDEQGRLTREEYYLPYLDTETPVSIRNYSYTQSDHCVEFVKILYLWEDENEINIYDDKGNLTMETKDGEGFSYEYDQQGRLTSIRTVASGNAAADTEIVAEVYWDDESFQSVEVMTLGDGETVVWLDQYNANWQKIYAGWYQGEGLDKSNARQMAELLCEPGYYADYYNGWLMEEMTNERTREVNGYISSTYDFYDYDEYGRNIWHFWLVNRDICMYANEYVYNGEGELTRELRYRITGEWEQMLVDKSSIALHRDDESRLMEIVRTGEAGDVLHRFMFDSKQHLIAQVDAEDNVMILWQKTEEEPLREQEQDQQSEESEQEQFYIVKKGDCLWSISEKLFGDGGLWTSLYEDNRDIIGENPSLIYEGMKLTVPPDGGAFPKTKETDEESLSGQ